MDKNFKTVFDKAEVLLQICGEDLGEFNLEGFFLKCNSKNREALYIPGCLVAVEAFGEEFGVSVEERIKDYFNCERPEVLMNRGEYGINGKLYISGDGYGVEDKVMFPEKVGDFFKDSSFNYDHTLLAFRLFLYARKNIKYS